jgi:hypothetical protein
LCQTDDEIRPDESEPSGDQNMLAAVHNPLISPAK